MNDEEYLALLDAYEAARQSLPINSIEREVIENLINATLDSWDREREGVSTIAPENADDMRGLVFDDVFEAIEYLDELGGVGSFSDLVDLGDGYYGVNIPRVTP